MSPRTTAATIDEYIAMQPAERRSLLEEMRELIRSHAPEAVETISYAMPTFDMNGTHLVHFAALTNHTGFYPTGSGVAAFEGEIGRYKSTKGAIQFPLGEPLPRELIGRIVEFRVAAVATSRPRKTARRAGSRE
jgi:uncharacterized protein YdhG (YjbR/CyaY superfamily)